MGVCSRHAMALGDGFAVASRHGSCSRGPTVCFSWPHESTNTGLARSPDPHIACFARSSSRELRTSQWTVLPHAPPPMLPLSETAFSSPHPRVNFGLRRAAGRDACRHEVHEHLCDHTFSSLCKLPDPAAAVRGPKSVLGWLLFGQTWSDPRIHRSAPPRRPKSFSKPSEFLGRDETCLF